MQHSYKDKELRYLPLVYTMVSLNDDSLVSDYEDPEISFGVCSASTLLLTKVFSTVFTRL